MIFRDNDGNYAGLKCDTCGTEAPPQPEIMRGHGLANMGWWCKGGKHMCPSCPHPAEEGR